MQVFYGWRFLRSAGFCGLHLNQALPGRALTGNCGLFVFFDKSFVQ